MIVDNLRAPIVMTNILDVGLKPSFIATSRIDSDHQFQIAGSYSFTPLRYC